MFEPYLLPKTPLELRRDRIRALDVQAAIRIFEKQPGFVSSQASMLERLEALEEELPPESKIWKSDARADSIFKAFDIWSESFLTLVSNLDTLKALDTLLKDGIRRAWRDLTRFDLEVLPPVSETDWLFVKEIQRRARSCFRAANRRVADLENTASGAESGSPESKQSISVPTIADAPSQEQRNSVPDTSERKPVARDPKYDAIDDQLRKIANTHPRSHAEVFDFLEKRVPIPNADPFKRYGAWLAGFKRDPDGARVWLSKAWHRLNLPPFPRGPK